jgi:hypothetical protein
VNIGGTLKVSYVNFSVHNQVVQVIFKQKPELLVAKSLYEIYLELDPDPDFS